MLGSAAIVTVGLAVSTRRFLGGSLSLTSGARTIVNILKCCHSSGCEVSESMQRKTVSCWPIAETNDAKQPLHCELHPLISQWMSVDRSWQG